MTNTARNTLKENLIHTICNNNSLQRDWKIIKDDFNSMYPTFYATFQIKGIHLSNKEEQLLMLETLHFNTNTMAKVLGILPNSVYTSRYRLNKKINEAAFQLINTQ